MSRRGRGAAIGLCVTLVAIACGGSTTNSSGGGDASAGTAGAAGAAPGAGGSGALGTGGAGGSVGGSKGGSVADASADTSTDAAPVDDVTACAKYAEEACAFEAQCEPFFASWQWGGDVARCRDGLSRACRVIIRAKGSNTTAADFLAGANQTDGKSCTELLYASGTPVPLPPGNLADGEPCIVDAQCAGGSCPIEVGYDCGSCYTFDKPGDACTIGKCSGSSRCIAGTCIVPQALNQACDATHPCMQGLTCNGTCQVTAPGGTCPTGYECDLLAKGEVCESGSCKPASIGQPGDACTGLASFCAGGKYCFGTTACPQTTPVGGACTSTLDCDLLAYCASGTCAELPDSCP